LINALTRSSLSLTSLSSRSYFLTIPTRLLTEEYVEQNNFALFAAALRGAGHLLLRNIYLEPACHFTHQANETVPVFIIQINILLFVPS
jgi:hypothetical protein